MSPDTGVPPIITMNGILKLSNVIPDRLCNTLIEYHKANIDKAKKLDYDSRTSPYNQNNVICNELILEKDSYFETKVNECMAVVLEKYTRFYPYFYCDNVLEYQLREITGPTLEHIDHPIDSEYDVRNVSVIFGLNSDYEEGEFYFRQQDYKTTVKRGEALVFPVYYFYPHEVSAPIGSRYTINTWCVETTSVHLFGDA